MVNFTLLPSASVLIHFSSGIRESYSAGSRRIFRCFLGVAGSFSVAVRQRSRRASIFSIASPRLLAVYTRTLQASCIIGVLASYQPLNPFHDGTDCKGPCEGSGVS